MLLSCLKKTSRILGNRSWPPISWQNDIYRKRVRVTTPKRWVNSLSRLEKPIVNAEWLHRLWISRPHEPLVIRNILCRRTGISKSVLPAEAVRAFKSEPWKILSPRRIMAGKVWRCSQALPTDHEWMLYGLERSLSRRATRSCLPPRRYHHIATPWLLSARRRKTLTAKSSYNRAYLPRFLSRFHSVNPGHPRVIETIKKSAYIAPEMAMPWRLQMGNKKWTIIKWADHWRSLHGSRLDQISSLSLTGNDVGSPRWHNEQLICKQRILDAKLRGRFW